MGNETREQIDAGASTVGGRPVVRPRVRRSASGRNESPSVAVQRLAEIRQGKRIPTLHAAHRELEFLFEQYPEGTDRDPGIRESSKFKELVELLQGFARGTLLKHAASEIRYKELVADLPRGRCEKIERAADVPLEEREMMEKFLEAMSDGGVRVTARVVDRVMAALGTKTMDRVGYELVLEKMVALKLLSEEGGELVLQASEASRVGGVASGYQGPTLGLEAGRQPDGKLYVIRRGQGRPGGNPQLCGSVREVMEALRNQKPALTSELLQLAEGRLLRNQRVKFALGISMGGWQLA